MILTEELLNEILKSEIEIHRDTDLESHINDGLKGRIHSAHTRVMHSLHLRQNGHSVLRIMKPKHTVEYHFINHNGNHDDHKMDNKSMAHSMKIIHDDAIEHLKHNRKIHLQSNTDKQHENYGRLAKRLVKNISNKTVKDIGHTNRLDGKGPARTHLIEGLYDSNIAPFSKFIDQFYNRS